MLAVLDLLDAWGDWRPTGPPYLFDADRPFLASRRSSGALVSRASWEDAYRSDDFADPDDRRLHVGLLPLPYLGDLRRASVYVLLLNPGLSPTDYYGEYKVPAYRDALLTVHRQEFSGATFRFMHLDPQFGWSLADRLSEDRFERPGDELAGEGLYVTLEAWGSHFLRVGLPGRVVG